MNAEVAIDLGARLTEALNDAIASRAIAPFCKMAAHMRQRKLEKPAAACAAAPGVELLPEVQAYLDEHEFVRKLSQVVAELVSMTTVPDDRVGLLAAKVGRLETATLLPLLQLPGFWAKESGAPLLGRNAGFLTPEGGIPESWRERVAKWPELCGAGEAETPTGACDDEGALRIFEKDADRTFVDATHKQLYINLLMRVWPENRDYNQGLGYTCSLLMLLFDEDTIVRLLTAFTRSDKYTPGYWRAAPDAYVRDAKVYGRLLQEREPDTAALLMVCVPESYASKWFNGLCLHVLPYEALFAYIEQFILEGHVFLFKFALALIARIKPGLLKCEQTQVNLLYEHLRLDPKQYPDDLDGGVFFSQMVEEAKAVKVDPAQIARLREEEAEALAAHRRRVAEQEAAYSDDEIVFSDEED